MTITILISFMCGHFSNKSALFFESTCKWSELKRGNLVSEEEVKEGNRENRTSLSSELYSRRRRGDAHKQYHGKFWLNTWRGGNTVRGHKHKNSLSPGLVESPSLEICKTLRSKVLINLIWLWSYPFFEEVFGWDDLQRSLPSLTILCF